MSVWGVSLVKDEQDIIGYSLPRMAAQLDGVVVADNMSTDETRAILEDVAEKMGNIKIVDDFEPAYLQSVKMTGLARSTGADWVVPFDADEVWHCPTGPLADVLPTLDCVVAEAALYDYVASSDEDPNEPDPVRRIARRRQTPGRLPKVACRLLPGLVIEQGNHGARYPGPVLHCRGDLFVAHYPYRSAEQMARKAVNGAKAYEAAGDRLPDSTGQHWRDYGRFYDQGGLAAIEEIFTTWFYVGPDDSTTIVDPCPVPMP